MNVKIRIQDRVYKLNVETAKALGVLTIERTPITDFSVGDIFSFRTIDGFDGGVKLVVLEAQWSENPVNQKYVLGGNKDNPLCLWSTPPQTKIELLAYLNDEAHVVLVGNVLDNPLLR
jgi:hypothetical protein